MLTKPAIVTIIPAVQAVEYQPASLTCIIKPPLVDGEPPPPPTDPDTLVYLYVPSNPLVYVSETRTPGSLPAPAGYVCDLEPQLYFIPDPLLPGGETPVYEIRCRWTYP
jgi:hypothetical protein